MRKRQQKALFVLALAARNSWVIMFAIRSVKQRLTDSEVRPEEMAGCPLWLVFGEVLRSVYFLLVPLTPPLIF